MKRNARIALLPAALGAIAAGAFCGCASSSHRTTSAAGERAASRPASRSLNGAEKISGPGCEPLIARTLGTVAERIYAAASGANVVEQAVHRVQGSAALARAIAAHDAPAASATLSSLLAGQIARVQVLDGGKPFASASSTAGSAIAPVRGSIGGTNASFVLSTQPALDYMHVVEQVTGAQVVLLAGEWAASTLPAHESPPASRIPTHGSIEIAGRRYSVYSMTGTAFPSGALRIVLLVPPMHSVACLRSFGRVVAETLGHVGERIYAEEAGSATVRATLRDIEASAAFQRAVASRDIAAIRAAIVGFFAAHIHVVRVRVYAVDRSGAQRLLYDLGGPYVLAPVDGVVRSGGRIVGRFSYAIQDDAGYLRLARLFTGAEVLMRVGAKQVIGTLDPGPARAPDRGSVDYAGRRYEAYSFSGEAFPSGDLRISLLVPSGSEIGG